MSEHRGATAIPALAFAFFLFSSPLASQTTKTASAANVGPALTMEKAIALAEQGHCQEALPALKRAVNAQGLAERRREAGVLGLRCSLAMDSRELSLDFARSLGKQFP